MKRNLTGRSRLLSLIGLIGINSLLPLQAAPPPSAFGVWDRGSSYDPKDHPFLKGMAFNDKWASVEKQPGVFDWSTLDQAMDSAVQRDLFVYLSINVGPDSPEIFEFCLLCLRRRLAVITLCDACFRCPV